MREEMYSAYKPIDNLPRRVILDAIHIDSEGFRIIVRSLSLESEYKKIKISFGVGPLSTRIIDEGAYLMTLGAEHVNWWFFTSLKSKYINWFHYQSCGIYVGRNIVNYSIFTDNDCIDVIDIEPPDVVWL